MKKRNNIPVDMEQLYQDYSVPNPGEADKHAREGWLQTRCPFCSGNDGYHLGYHLTNHYYNCWRCGFHPTIKALSRILHINQQKVKGILRKYKKGTARRRIKTSIKMKRHSFKMPISKPIKSFPYAMNYLSKRRKNGFTKNQISKLVNAFEISTTGPVCIFKYGKKKIDLKYRITTPIYWQGDIVSWQTRDMTNKHKIKYIACPIDVETIHHKHILYANKSFDIDTCKEVVLVEGVFDVWKLYLAGIEAVAGFGVELKVEQILLLKKIPKLYIWLDPDQAGQRKGKDVLNRLIFAGCTVHTIEPGKTDPGDMSIKEVKRRFRNGKND